MEFESDFVQVIKLDPTYIRLEPNNLEVFSDTSFLKQIPYNPKSFSFITDLHGNKNTPKRSRERSPMETNFFVVEHRGF